MQVNCCCCCFCWLNILHEIFFVTELSKTTLYFCLFVSFSLLFLVLTTFFFNSSHSNLTDRHIKSLEFNVLDSLNTKLVRPVSITYFQVKRKKIVRTTVTNAGMKLLLQNRCLLLTEFSVRIVSYGPSFFPLRFMARAFRAWAINVRGKTRIHYLQG